jgi:PKD repeat protein
MRKILCLFAIVTGINIMADPGFAFNLPKNNSQGQYFCVFGLRGSSDDGADNAHPDQVVYFDVPEGQISDLTIDVFDPDTGGRLDQKDPNKEDWETIFQFAVYGKEKALLEKKSFGESADYDMDYYRFGPYPKEMGLKIGKFYRFELVVSPVRTLILKGDDLNLFSLRVSPEDVQASSGKISLRLVPRKNSEMSFYPEIPANTDEIIVENYDLDPDGGSARLYDPLTRKSYGINNSGSGVWAQTRVQISPSETCRRLAYIITKKIQQKANASICVKDSQGRVLPIYFSDTKDPAVLKTASASIPFEDKEIKIFSVLTENKERKSRPPESEPVLQRVKPAPSSDKSVASVAKKPDVVAPIKTVSAQCNKFIFDGTGSHDPNNEKLSFFWDFGDSTTSIEPVVTHVFEKGGQYKVSLTVKDTSGLACDSASITQIVHVNMPPEPAFVAPETACVGEAVIFDASSTTDDTPENLTYIWDFNDGDSAEGKQAAKKFEKGGVYSVKLTVDDNANTACSKVFVSKKIFINSPPKAMVEGENKICILPNKTYAASFDAGRSTDADKDKLEFTWDFGDGTIIEGGSKANHEYKKGGKFTVKVIVDDKRNTPWSKDTATMDVVVNTPPVAAGQADFACCIETESVFDGSASSDADKDSLTYQWEFGDGTIAQGVKTTHRYTKGGTYTVTLKVDDNSGTACSSSQTSFKVRINEEPVPVIKVR